MHLLMKGIIGFGTFKSRKTYVNNFPISKKVKIIRKI